ncbi:hypothetical protein SAMN05216207_104931 [Pseudonocardia ammonioxydans]|uniref:Uncharacterized protein n=2 Tax=Pseudonocardia ammonioxydans TaxID=260086 RepID=A0A1I5GPV2_PSUAM|nr:hypothetical protein SAMN05216207_104931 [Pseudonocardia ammonioxydans]
MRRRMHRAAPAGSTSCGPVALGIVSLGAALVLGGCGVTLQDEPEPLGPTTEAPAPAPTVSVRPDAPSAPPSPVAGDDG